MEHEILIVDDDDQLCMTLSDIFQEMGYNIAIASNGQEVKKRAEQTAFNIALIDIKLPDTDGITLMKELKIKYPDIMCIIITGHASLQNSINALKEGANSYFLKPININELIRDMNHQLEKQFLKRKLRNFNQKLEQQVKIKTKELNDALEQEKLYKIQLLKSSQFKSEFMASMSHELRTPLTSIIGFTDVILERIGGEINEEQEKYLTNVKSSALHLLDLINDVLDISKIESGKMEVHIEDVNLSMVINQVDIMVKLMYKKKNLKIEIMEIDKKKVIQIDRKKFMEILYNLLCNAIKYTREGGIKLEILENEDDWIFNIIDTGIGIAKEDYDIVFKEFKRVKTEYTYSIEGTGLGLPLTKKLIELHGGNIFFTSELGKGSTFTFTLPKIKKKTLDIRID